MSKQKEPTVEELLAKIKSLEDDLKFEKEFNRKMLKLPPDASNDELTAAQPWSTEWMQQEIDNCEVTHGAITKVYKQRVFKLIRQQNGVIVIKQHNGDAVLKQREKYSLINESLSIESFFMLLEIMEFAEREFGLDRKAVIDALTDGEGIKIKKSINSF